MGVSCRKGKGVSVNSLVTGLMIAYLVCSYFLVYRYTDLAHRAARVTAISFRFRWYERLAGTYVLALPIFLLLVYLIGEWRA